MSQCRRSVPKGTTGACASSPALRPGSAAAGGCICAVLWLLSWLPLHLQTRYTPNEVHRVAEQTANPPRQSQLYLLLPGLELSSQGGGVHLVQSRQGLDKGPLCSAVRMCGCLLSAGPAVLAASLRGASCLLGHVMGLFPIHNLELFVLLKRSLEPRASLQGQSQVSCCPVQFSQALMAP